MPAKRLLGTLTALLCLGASGAPFRYERTEGLNLNSFVRSGPVAAHVVLRQGAEPRIIVAFPAGNSGAGLWFSPLAQPATWTMEAAPVPVTQADARGRPLHGTRFTATIRAPRLVVRQAIVSSIRVLRDYQGLGTAPREVLTDATHEGATLSWARDRLDGAPGYRLAVKVVRGTLHGDAIDAAGGAITLEVTALTGEAPLTPLEGDSLLKYAADPDPQARNALTFLSYREKFLAGSWRFDTYFGRDTLMSLRLMMPALQPDAVEAGLRSVLERLSPTGEVAHEEDIGEFAILDHRRTDGTSSAAPVYDYKMIDSDVLLAPVARAWLLDDPRGRARAAAFLAQRIAGGRAGDLLLRNIRLVASKATPFAKDPTTAHLLALKPGVPVGEWRDSNDGLGGGRIPYDVNAVLVPAALEAAGGLYEAGLLAPYLKHADAALFARLPATDAVWRSKAPPLFAVTIPSAEARRAVAAYARTADVPDKDALTVIGDAPVRFNAIALDANGAPIRVMNSDDGFALLFGHPSAAELDVMADTIAHAFPAGLSTPVGMLVANPVFAPPALQARFGSNAYHGTVVWSWQQALAYAGVRRQMERRDLPGETGQKLVAALFSLEQAIRATAPLRNSELWSWRYANGRYEPVAFGAGGKDADESNAAQLWSTVYLGLAVPPPPD